MTATTGFTIVVPARYDSSRFPGKPLAILAGKPMILHVWERAMQSAATEVVIATDKEQIASVCRDAGADVCLTSSQHPTGTDRIAEVVANRQWPGDTIVVNLQGDEPHMPIEALRQVAENLHAHPLASMATLSTPIQSMTEATDPNVVKVVCDQQGMALYFSRSSIPFQRDAERSFAMMQRHLGIYAFRASFLREFQSMPEAPVEGLEKLEQLRALWFGKKIHVAEAAAVPGPGIDTPEQLAAIEKSMPGKGGFNG